MLTAGTNTNERGQGTLVKALEAFILHELLNYIKRTVVGALRGALEADFCGIKGLTAENLGYLLVRC